MSTFPHTKTKSYELENCAKCGARRLSLCTEPDPCIGYLPGVYNACCGHGEDDNAYITFGFEKHGHKNYAYGQEAIEIMTAMRTALANQSDERWHGGHD